MELHSINHARLRSHDSRRAGSPEMSRAMEVLTDVIEQVRSLQKASDAMCLRENMPRATFARSVSGTCSDIILYAASHTDALIAEGETSETCRHELDAPSCICG